MTRRVCLLASIALVFAACTDDSSMSDEGVGLEARPIGDVQVRVAENGALLSTQLLEFVDAAGLIAGPAQTITCTLSGCQGTGCVRNGCKPHQAARGGPWSCTAPTCQSTGNCTQAECAESWSVTIPQTP